MLKFIIRFFCRHRWQFVWTARTPDRRAWRIDYCPKCGKAKIGFEG